MGEKISQVGQEIPSDSIFKLTYITKQKFLHSNLNQITCLRNHTILPKTLNLTIAFQGVKISLFQKQQRSSKEIYFTFKFTSYPPQLVDEMNFIRSPVLQRNIDIQRMHTKSKFLVLLDNIIQFLFRQKPVLQVFHSHNLFINPSSSIMKVQLE